MKFTAKTEEQIEQAKIAKLLDTKEWCDFETIGSEEKYSKTCEAPMWKFTFKVWDVNGKQGVVSIHIVMNDDWDWLFRHYCASIGRMDLYQSQEADSHVFLGSTGRLKLGVKIDKANEYPPQNFVKDFDKNGAPQQNNKAKAPLEDDDINF